MHSNVATGGLTLPTLCVLVVALMTLWIALQ